MRLDKTTENMLWGRLANGDQDARRRLIESNRPLVLNIVSQMRGTPLDEEDMIAAGMVGLVHAVDTYDPSKSQFSTYATFHIKGRILHEAKWAGPGIRVPDKQWRVLNAARRSATQSECEKVIEGAGIDMMELKRLQNLTQPWKSINTLTASGSSLEDTLTSGEPEEAKVFFGLSVRAQAYISDAVDDAPQPIKDALLHLQGRPTEKKRSWSTKSARKLIQEAKAYIVAKLHDSILVEDGE